MSHGERIEAIDLARGVAVSLMILSHGVKALLSFDQFPEWGLVPIHLITKSASTLFFIVFGMALSIAFVPSVGTSKWPEKRKRLLIRSLKILFWYKILTVVEMFPVYEPELVMRTLLYGASAIYTEILGFYAIALFWMPFALRPWKALPLWGKALVPLFFAVTSMAIFRNVNFGEWTMLQALLVEHPDFYTWGQLTRAPLVFAGMLLGELWMRSRSDESLRRWVTWGLSLTAVACLGVFVGVTQGDLPEGLRAIALNEGKHPPEFDFMIFSIGLALTFLTLCLVGGNRLARVLRPITIIGQDALHAFIFHIVVVFVIFRYLLGYFQQVPYEHALFVAVCLIALTPLWIRTKNWVARHS